VAANVVSSAHWEVDKKVTSPNVGGIPHDPREKILYHLIHSLKLLTHWSASFAALPLFWRHRVRVALLLISVPPILASVLIIRYVDLDPYKRSVFERCLKPYMTKERQSVRFMVILILVLGAWYRRSWLVSLDLLTVLFGWFYEKLFPREGK